LSSSKAQRKAFRDQLRKPFSTTTETAFGEERQKAFDFCADATKQLITLSAAIVAFMVTFGKDFIGEVPPDAYNYAYWAWGLHLLSIVLGIFVLLALTGRLEPKWVSGKKDQNYVPSIRGKVALGSASQIGFFCIAMIFTAVFGYKTTNSSNAHHPTTTLDQRFDHLQQELLKVSSALQDASKALVDAEHETRTQHAQIIERINQSQTAIQRSCRMAPPLKRTCCVAKDNQTSSCPEQRQ
jgi:hypothetical protein